MKSTAHLRVSERGILTSAYKQEIKHSIREMKSGSLSHLKNAFLRKHESLTSQTAAILQVSIFTFALILILL